MDRENLKTPISIKIHSHTKNAISPIRQVARELWRFPVLPHSLHTHSEDIFYILNCQIHDTVQHFSAVLCGFYCHVMKSAFSTVPHLFIRKRPSLPHYTWQDSVFYYLSVSHRDSMFLLRNMSFFFYQIPKPYSISLKYIRTLQRKAHSFIGA